jgi:predicted HAD superfamily Cof-like phosphohydrolase
MKKQLDDIMQFHETFGCYIQRSPGAVIPQEIKDVRQRILQEEVDELDDAAKKEDIVAVADALGDIIYVALGTVISYGLQDKFEAIFAEIHRSNMSKLDENGKPILREDGKILKSKLYTRPELSGIIFDRKG